MARRPLKPTDPAPVTPYTLRALRALHQGVAGPEQQKHFLEWLVKHVANIGGISFVPGQTDTTAFLEGRRFVGKTIVDALEIKPEALTEKAHNE